MWRFQHDDVKASAARFTSTFVLKKKQCNETNAVPMEMHTQNPVRLQHAVHLNVKCVIFVHPTDL